MAVTVTLSCADSTGAPVTYAIASGPSHGTLGAIAQATGQVTTRRPRATAAPTASPSTPPARAAGPRGVDRVTPPASTGTGGSGGSGGTGGSGGSGGTGGTGASPPPADAVAPAISGEARAGGQLTCPQGSWTNGPTSFAYQWSFDGTPIPGASGSTYTVPTADEGLMLTCTVTATGPGGTGAPATSAGASVPFAPSKGCPAASGSLQGARLGLVALGMTRAQGRPRLHAQLRSRQALSGLLLPDADRRQGRLRLPRAAANAAGCAAGPVRRPRRLGLDGRLVLRGGRGRAGASILSAGHQLTLGTPIRIGLNTWYLAPDGAANVVLKVRGGIVQEIGIAASALTSAREPSGRSCRASTDRPPAGVQANGGGAGTSVNGGRPA